MESGESVCWPAARFHRPLTLFDLGVFLCRMNICVSLEQRGEGERNRMKRKRKRKGKIKKNE